MKTNFWKNKKVLITGFRGFLGSHLTKSLVSRGADVVGLDIRTDIDNFILGRKELKNIKIVKCHVSDYNRMKKILKSGRFKIVLHLAACALVGDCLRNPRKAFSSNIGGTWTLLEAARTVGRKRFEAIIVSSSDKAYGDQNRLPYLEDSPLKGDHPYDASKACADLLAYTYFHTYGMPVCVTRCGNIFGPGDMNFSRIVPSAVTSAIKGKTFSVRSDGKFVRDYVYIDDIVDGYMKLAEKLQALRLGGEAFNLSYEHPVSVLDLVRMIYRLAGRKPDYRILDNARHEIKRQFLSSGKARKILDWRPRRGLAEGLKQTIDWYKKCRI